MADQKGSAVPPPNSKIQTKLSIPLDSRPNAPSLVGILAHSNPLGALFQPSTLHLPPARSEAGIVDEAGAVLDPALAVEGKVGDTVLEEVGKDGSGGGALGARARPEPKPLALILHGVLAHKDQIYHKKLVAGLDMDSFRFDFRANHESPGEWSMSSFHDDVQDMRAVITHLRKFFNYRVHLLVAHSRGALDTWTYLAEQERSRRAGLVNEETEVPSYVVCLGSRWRMEKIYDRMKIYEEGFRTEGFFRWKAKVAGKEVEALITPAQVEEFAKFPVVDYVRDAPLDSDYLLVMGTADKIVPSSDVGYYMNALTSQAGRRPGSVQMHLVEHADHNFVGHYDEVVETILSWLRARQASRTESRVSSGIDDLPTTLDSATEDRAGIPSRATATAGVGGSGKL
ncbi:hypothetical protein CF327_g6368 [Tilletia walkeri]|uniref:Serine aminopeptidase S33 domain-containing protein n=1 Tax=Tilletia walkeri TaxID=117179 RepID=A0A8X7N5L7_9BASI|nr:hypothetical protein CF327_g6368 [Tilletia walkeri]KAE8266085.1 hypothetical protein A4X09_0g6267 [Tilletia walkeri]